jgi:hypothetical protein
MINLRSDGGVSRGALILVVAAAVVAGATIAGVALLHRYAGPDAVASALEGALGVPASVGEVKIRPLELEVSVVDVALGPLTTLRSASVRLDPSSIVSRKWKIRSASLCGPVWTMPSSADEVEPFAKGLLLPLWLADKAASVTIEGGALLAGDGKTRLCSELRGRLSAAPEGETSRRVQAHLEGVLLGFGEASADAVYSTFDGVDSTAVDSLSLSCKGLSFSGAGTLAWDAPTKLRAEIISPELFGGSGVASVRLEQGERGVGLDARVELADCDGAELLRDALGVELLASGSLSADVRLDGRLAGLMSDGVAGLEARCELNVSDAVLNPAGPLAEVLPFAAGARERDVEWATARLAVSGSAIDVLDMTIESEGVTWELKGRVMRDRSLTGAVVGRIPAEMLGGEGTVLSLVKTMLADRDGRIPAAFTVGGSLDDPRVHFDVEHTAEVAAASGRPQAKQLLKAMSRSDVEKLNRSVDQVLAGLKIE